MPRLETISKSDIIKSTADLQAHAPSLKSVQSQSAEPLGFTHHASNRFANIWAIFYIPNWFVRAPGKTVYLRLEFGYKISYLEGAREKLKVKINDLRHSKINFI